jgi:hypothetical protein
MILGINKGRHFLRRYPGDDLYRLKLSETPATVVTSVSSQLDFAAIISLRLSVANF